MWLREKRYVFLWVAKDTETQPGSHTDKTPSLNREHCPGSQGEMIALGTSLVTHICLKKFYYRNVSFWKAQISELIHVS